MKHKDTSRTAQIVRVSFCGIGVNILLAGFKAVIGFAANSIAVLLDAVNNLSDVLSSVITVIGTKLAGKPADREHPFGHGRVEYITASVIAILVMAAGLMSLRESILKLITPEAPAHNPVTAALILAGVITKIFLGRFYRKRGNALNSASLTASGTDALMDAVLSTATLFSALLNILFGWNLEGILGAVISMFILKAGYDIMHETIGHIIGIRSEADFSQHIKERICSFPDVIGAYDLILHNYGPEAYFGSVHIEIPDDLTAREIDSLTRKIVPMIYEEFGVLLTVGIYAANTADAQSMIIREAVCKLIAQHPEIRQMHGFYADPNENTVSFDLIFDYQAEQPEAVQQEITAALTNDFPAHRFHINIDRDFSE